MIRNTIFVIIIGFIFNNSSLFAFNDFPVVDPLIGSDGFTQALPVAIVKNSDFSFDTVDGFIIKHDFIIKNQGDIPLNIIDVKTGCGCSSANYDSQILPGEHGKIGIKIDTEGYGGKAFNEKIKVYTNDPHQNTIIFNIKGKVDKFAIVNPDKVRLVGKAEDALEVLITITPNLKYNFNIIDTYLERLQNEISYLLTKKTGHYILNIKNQQKIPGTYWGKIHLKTDSPLKKEISIYIFAKIS